MITSLNVRDPQLLKDLDKHITSLALAGEKVSRSEFICDLIRNHLNQGDVEGVELPKLDVEVRDRIFLTIPAKFKWLSQRLSEVVQLKKQAGRKTNIQNEILVLAVHGFISDPDYGNALRSLLNDSRR